MDFYDNRHGIVNGDPGQEQTIRDEIDMLEERLSVISAADDSAYAKLLAKAYHRLLGKRRSQLETMKAACKTW